MSNNKMATKADLQELYNRILPYLGGMPEFVGNKINRSDIYSTSEKIVGCFTDGRPIYQKTIDFGDLPKNTNKTVTHNISNLRQFVSIEGIAYNLSDLSFSCAIPNGEWTGDNRMSMWMVTNGIKITTAADWTGWKAYITLRYTKTTDAANSYNCANENDYSTTEKIIGTWIDGKKIYQKTILCTAPTVVTTGTQVIASTDIGATVDKVIDMKFNLTVSGLTVCFPFTASNHSSDTKNNTMYIQAKDNSASSDKNKIQVCSASTATNGATIYVTIQYTKTT